MAGVYLTDGITVIDVSESHIAKSDTPRLSIVKNIQDKDVIQTYGTLGRHLSIEGVWPIGASGVNDGRTTLEYWRTNNILVRYDDEQVTTISGFGTIGWFTIRDFKWDLIRGQSHALITYHIELTESIRMSVDDNLALPSGMYVGQGGISANVLLTPTPSPTLNSAGSSNNFGAQQFSHNKHTFIDQNNNWWLVSMQSTGSNPSVLTFCMSSAGEEWSWISDYVAEANRGWAVRFFYPSSVGVCWTQDHVLQFVMGGISYPGPVITWGTPTSVNSTLTANEGNYRPDLFITPTPRFYISVCSASSAYLLYDSNDGNNWKSQVGSDPGNVDANRYTSVIVTSSSGANGSIGFIKRVFIADDSNLQTRAWYGGTEATYTGTIGDASGISYDQAVSATPATIPTCGFFAVTALPLASYGSVFFLNGSNQLVGAYIDEYNFNPGAGSWNRFTFDSSSLDRTVGTPQYITCGLSSAEDQVNVFYMKNGFPLFLRSWNLRNDKTSPVLTASKTTFGTGSVGEVSYLNTPDIPSLSQSFISWQYQRGTNYSDQRLIVGVP